MLSPFMTKRFLGCMDPLQSRSGAHCCPVIPLKEVCRHVAELSQNPHTHIHFLCPPTHLSCPRLSLTRTILKAGLLILLPAYNSLMSDNCTDPSSLLLHPSPPQTANLPNKSTLGVLLLSDQGFLRRSG